MRRIASALAVSLPIAIAGSMSAHQAGYMIEATEASTRTAILRVDGHSYLTDFAFVIPAALTVVLFGFLASMQYAMKSQRSIRVPALPFATVPPLAFIIQELAERAASGAPLAALASELSFVSGLLLQLPFALIACLLARAILKTALRVARAIESHFSGARRRATYRLAKMAQRDAIASFLSRMADEAPGRGPPSNGMASTFS